MGNEINDNGNLYMPPKLEETFTMNTATQQDVMGQPQDMFMGQPQNMFVGQPEQVAKQPESGEEQTE